MPSVPVDGRPDELFFYVGVNRGEELPAYAWPGGYPLIYVAKNGDVECAKCANDPTWFEDYPAIAAEVYYEGPTLTCAGCNATIESAYGDPETEGN